MKTSLFCLLIIFTITYFRISLAEETKQEDIEKEVSKFLETICPKKPNLEEKNKILDCVAEYKDSEYGNNKKPRTYQDFFLGRKRRYWFKEFCDSYEKDKESIIENVAGLLRKPKNYQKEYDGDVKAGKNPWTLINKAYNNCEKSIK